MLTAALSRPTVSAMRERLGGRASSSDDAGRLVQLQLGPEALVRGVVIFAEGDEAHVLAEGGVVRRAKRDALASVIEPVHEELAALAADVRVFAKLEEGDAVRYVDSKGVLGEGLLVEKCRYGALVARPDNVVMGVGFRKLWPLSGDAAQAKDEEQAKQ